MIGDILFGISYLVYLIFGFYTGYFCLITEKPQKKHNFPVKILYYHGVFFMIAFISIFVVILFGQGMQALLTIIRDY